MTRTRRLLATVLVLAGLLIAVVPTGAIFSDSGWIAPSIAVIVLVVAIGTVFRALPRVGGSGLAILPEFIITFAALPYLCAPSALLGGLLPVPSSYGAVFSGVSSGFGQVFSTTVPVATSTGFITLLVIGLGLLAMMVDALALDFHLEKPAALIVLSAWALPALLAGAQVGWARFGAAAAGFVLVLLSRYALGATSKVPVTAVVSGGVALAIGVALPLALPTVPDSHRTRLGTGDLKVANPFLDLRKDLAKRSDNPLLRYTTDAKSPEPIRLTAVSDFDGRTWMPEDFTLRTANAAVRGLPATRDITKGKTTTAESDITVDDLSGSYLPAPYAPQRVRGAGDGWIYDPSTLTMVSHNGLKSEMRYSVRTVTGRPTSGQLRRAGAVDKQRFATELGLPGSLPASVKDTAKRITRGADDQWERAAKIQAYLRSDRFSYSLNAPSTASGDAIADFLRDKRGYCVQFSSTMVVMARYLGIPARIAVGYTPGEKDSHGTYTVTSKESHAWPELYFPGYGWTRFEPTPGGTTGTPPAWTGAQEDQRKPAASASPTPTEAQHSAGARPTPSAGASQAASGPQQTTAPPVAGSHGERAAAVPRWLWLTAGIVVLAALVLLAPRLLRAQLRRRRLAAGGAGRQWREFLALLVDYGRRPGVADTVWHTAGQLARLCGDDERLEALGHAVEAQRYGHDPEADEAQGLAEGEARAAATAVRDALRADSGAGRRVLAAWLPPSLFHRF